MERAHPPTHPMRLSGGRLGRQLEEGEGESREAAQEQEQEGRAGTTKGKEARRGEGGGKKRSVQERKRPPVKDG